MGDSSHQDVRSQGATLTDDGPDLYVQWTGWKQARDQLVEITGIHSRRERNRCKDATLVPLRMHRSWGGFTKKRYKAEALRRTLRGYEFVLRGMRYGDLSLVAATGLFHSLIPNDWLWITASWTKSSTFRRAVELVDLARGDSNSIAFWDWDGWYRFDGEALEDSRDGPAALRVIIASHWWRVAKALCTHRDVRQVVHHYEDHLLPVASKLGLSDVLDAMVTIRRLPTWYMADDTRCLYSQRDRLDVPDRPFGTPAV